MQHRGGASPSLRVFATRPSFPYYPRYMGTHGELPLVVDGDRCRSDDSAPSLGDHREYHRLAYLDFHIRADPRRSGFFCYTNPRRHLEHDHSHAQGSVGSDSGGLPGREGEETSFPSRLGSLGAFLPLLCSESSVAILAPVVADVHCSLIMP